MAVIDESERIPCIVAHGGLRSVCGLSLLSLRIMPTGCAGLRAPASETATPEPARVPAILHAEERESAAVVQPAESATGDVASESVVAACEHVGWSPFDPVAILDADQAPVRAGRVKHRRAQLPFIGSRQLLSTQRHGHP